MAEGKYTLREHLLTCGAAPGEYDLELKVNKTGSLESVFTASVIIGNDDFVFDLLPIMTGIRVNTYYTIVAFELTLSQNGTVVETETGDWVYGYKDPSGYTNFVRPFRYITERFSPLYPIPITGKNFTVVVDGVQSAHTGNVVQTVTYSPATSFSTLPPNPQDFEKACEVVQICYFNAYGAFVNYIPKGNCYKRDSYSRLTYKPNRYKESEYKNTIKTEYIVNTELLSKAQADILVEDLLRSPYIKFYHPDYPTGVVVHISESSMDYKDPLKDENSGMYFTLTFVVDDTLANA